MLKNKEGGFGLFPLLTLLFGSAIIVGAVALNNTDNSSFFNSSFNDSLSLSINETLIENLSINISVNDSSLVNESINATMPAENSTVNKTTNNFIDNNLIETNKHKLNDKTKEYLKNVSDKKEQREFIIKFKNSIDENKLGKVKIDRKNERFKTVKIKSKVEDAEQLLNDSEIKFLELDQKTEILGFYNNYTDNIQSNIIKTKSPDVWNFTRGKNVKIAVLDTGIAQHDDLSISGGTSIVSPNYYDNNGHGTAVAGVISGVLNNDGLAGVAPEAQIYAVKIMDGSSGSLSDAIFGVQWAIDNHMGIMSISFGMETYSQIFKEVLQDAYDNDILIVAASGNNGQNNILYPAKYDAVIAVGAVGENNGLAYFSSYGFEQELVAPGVDINSTFLDNGYSVLSGTSMAAPHVAGVAALIKAFNISLTNEQIRAKLRNDALDLGDAGKDDNYGYGLVQANLQANNFTIINLSYFYEIFNISDFRTINESYVLWLSKNGTIDEVNFIKGLYLVNITFINGSKKSNIYNVSENGTIFILATSLIFDDFFSTDGGTTIDRIAWINDNMTVRLSTNAGTVQVECFTVGPARQFNSFDYCYADTQAHMDSCESDPDIDCAITTCEVVGTSGIGTQKEIISYNFAHSNTSYGRIYTDCSNPGGSQETSSTHAYYIVNKKAALCINSSTYNVSGWYGTDWTRIAQGSCSSTETCVSTANFTSESDYINPCINQNTCTGTVQVITEDRNGNPIKDLLVTRDDVSNKTTNSVGVAEYSLSKTCSQSMQFVVKCGANNGTTCGAQSTTLETNSSYRGLVFDCSICSGTPDLQIDVDNVRTNKDKDNITVNISLSGSFSATNINITFKVQDDTGLIAREDSQLFNLSNNSFKFIIQSLTLNENDDFLHVYVDTKNIVAELNEKNNYALVPLFKPQIYAYLSINTGYDSINNEIRDFLKLYVNEVSSQSQANVTIAVGLPKKNSIIEARNWFTQKNYQWFFTTAVYYNNKPLGSKPYNGIVGAFRDDYNYIFIGGNDIDGLLAALKRLISARSLFFSELKKDKVSVIEDTDISGIAVADLLRNPSNKPYYNQRGSPAFANVVSRVLNNNNFEIAIKTVQTLNTTSYNQSTILRLKNVNSDFSSNYKDVIVNNSKPIIFAGGAHSNLLRWEEESTPRHSLVPIAGVARLLVNEGRDVWEVEITGGSTQDCETCPNYKYEDLVDYYWTALISGVQKYSGQNVTQYIGHSNGCRVALDSLKNWSSIGKNNAGYYFDSSAGIYQLTNLTPNPVETFIGVGCPGAFNGTSSFITSVQNNPNSVVELQEDGITHPNRRQIARTITWIGDFLPRDNPISLNLWSQYVYWILNGTDKQPGQGLSINKSYFIYGVGGFTGFGGQNDGLMTTNDQVAIANNIISNNTNKLFQYQVSHGNLPDDISIKIRIMELLR